MTPNRSLAAGLWPHQRDAVKRMASYVASTPRPSEVAALVTMPTGTGKTAVVAGIIDSGKRQGHWLVLAPRTALVRQLCRVLDTQLWTQLGMPRPTSFPQVRQLPTASRISELADITTPTVFVDTIHKLVEINKTLKDNAAQRDTLFSHFNAVMIDEGHYEPSPSWSMAARSLRLPVVLFTATPYRNDELHFQIDPDHRHSYHYHQAVDADLLRQPRFRTLAAGTTEQFIDQTIEFVTKQRLVHARVIVRCKDKDAIVACVGRLRQRGQAAIGIHDRFVNSGQDYLTDKVPAPHDTDAQYWVHQHKLMEGIDDPAFRVVAFHDALNNDRSVIQQIGRALRRPTPGPKTAWVLSRDANNVQQVWERYLHFDRHGGQSTATAPEFTQCLLAAQPVAAYYDTQFRAPIDLTSADLWRQFAYPPAAYILRAPEGVQLSLRKLSDDIVEEYTQMGLAGPQAMYPDDQTVVIGYVAIGNSAALISGLFLQGSLGFTVIRVVNGRVFVFDTHKLLPKCIRKQLHSEARATLSKLMDPGTRITTVSLDNTDVSPHALRSRSLSAASIDAVAPGLTDYAFVCRTAAGYTSNSSLGSHTPRYLGLTRARVRDGHGVRLIFNDFRDWTNAVSDLLDDDAASSTATLDRYAEAIDPPSDMRPRTCSSMSTRKTLSALMPREQSITSS